MSLLEKFDALETTRQELLGHGTNPTDVIIERVISATESVIGGKLTAAGAHARL